MGIISPRLKDPNHRVLLGVQLGTSQDPQLRAFQREKVHKATSTHQRHGIAINSADPLFSTNVQSQDKPL